MRVWINYLGAAVLVVLGILLYSVDADFPTAGSPVLALPLILVGLVWAGLTFRRQLAAPHGAGRSSREDD